MVLQNPKLEFLGRINLSVVQQLNPLDYMKAQKVRTRAMHFLERIFQANQFQKNNTK
jgi:hypothetical protein